MPDMRAASRTSKGDRVNIDHIAVAGFVFDPMWNAYVYVGRDKPRFYIQQAEVEAKISGGLVGEEREIAVADALVEIAKGKDLPPPPMAWQPAPGLRVQVPRYPDCPVGLQTAYPSCIVRSYPDKKPPQCTRKSYEGCPVVSRTPPPVYEDVVVDPKADEQAVDE
jgi:hypothetical protein